MKIILLQDLNNLGKKNQIKIVTDGYARNFLIPRNLAKPATKKALIELEKQKEIEAKKAEKVLKEIQNTVSKIDGQEIEIFHKAKENGELYGSIDTLKVSKKLKDLGFKKIKKDQIQLKDPIKKLGEYNLTVSFDHGLEAIIKLIVREEKKK